MISPEKKQQLTHGIAGIAIIFKGLDKNDHGNGAVAVVFIVCGALLIAYAALHSRLHHTAFTRHFEIGVFGVEALIFALSAAVYASHHKTALPIAYLCLAVTYLYIGLRRNRALLAKSH